MLSYVTYVYRIVMTLMYVNNAIVCHWIYSFLFWFRSIFTNLPTPLLSILLAVFTVSPNKQYRGIFRPTTPATQGPVWMPIRKRRVSSGRWRILNSFIALSKCRDIDAISPRTKTTIFSDDIQLVFFLSYCRCDILPTYSWLDYILSFTVASLIPSSENQQSIHTVQWERTINKYRPVRTNNQ